MAKLLAYKPELGLCRDHAKSILTKHGVTEAGYMAMLASQGGGCAICGNPPDTRKAHALDHDHETGKARGILCQKCNTGLGQFNDRPELLHLAIQYLNRFK